MEFITDVFEYATLMIFFENIVFSRALGSSTACSIVKNKQNLGLFGVIMTSIIVVSMIISYFVNPLILSNPSISYYIEPIAYVLIIGFVYILALIISNKIFTEKKRDEVLQIIHISSFNCAVLGAMLLSSNVAGLTLGGYIGFGIGIGVGFTVVAYLLSLAFEHLNSINVPEEFRGLPITLIYIGMISLTVYGLIGHELPF